jgi:hypothetical protein
MRSACAVRFGTLLQIRGALAAVIADPGLKEGEELDFQIDLSDFGAVVRGQAEVLRVEHRDGTASRHLLRIRRMARFDKGLLAAWCEEHRSLGDHRPTSVPSSPLLGSVDSWIDPTAARDLPWPPPPPSHTPSKYSISSCQQREGTGRAAIRAVLRSALEGHRRGAATSAPDPQVDLRAQGSSPRVEVHYRTDPAWRRDWEAWLQQGLVLVPAASHALELDSTLSLRLVFRDRLDQTCTGRVVLHQADGFVIALDIEPRRLCCPEMIDADPDLPAADREA